MLLVMNFWYIREFRDSNEYTTFNILTVEQKTTSKPIQTQGLIKKKKDSGLGEVSYMQF